MKTEQEEFWQGEFGDAYTDRNAPPSLKSNLNLFAKVLSKTSGVRTVYEVGTNRGLNLDALRHLLPDGQLHGIEINHKAAAIAAGKGHQIEVGSVLSCQEARTFDLVFTRGVLIHINPAELPAVYDFMGRIAGKYILVDEYFSPHPVAIDYRGNKERLFKRDFAKEIMDRLSLELVDYGFTWKHDPNFPLDDSTWFLFRKTR